MKMRLLVLLMVCLSLPAFSAELKGVTMDDQITVDGKTLVLNGMGRRIKYVFNVYVAGLYLENKSQDAEAILNSPETKKLIMEFKMDVDKEKIRETWTDALNLNCQDKCEEFKPYRSQFIDWMSDMKSKKRMSYTFTANAIEIEVKGEVKGKIENAGFAKSVLRVFMGPNPPNSELKEGLIGKK